MSEKFWENGRPFPDPDKGQGFVVTVEFYIKPMHADANTVENVQAWVMPQTMDHHEMRGGVARAWRYGPTRVYTPDDLPDMEWHESWHDADLERIRIEEERER